MVTSEMEGRSMELRDYDPWAAVGGAQDFASFMKRSRSDSDDGWKPMLEAFHNERELVLRFELAGVEPADIDLRVDNRVLHVRGVRRPSDQPPPELRFATSAATDRSTAASPYPKALWQSRSARLIGSECST
jgi:HSP20 family molecular chaperone IbpA